MGELTSPPKDVLQVSGGWPAEGISDARGVIFAGQGCEFADRARVAGARSSCSETGRSHRLLGGGDEESPKLLLGRQLLERGNMP